jgi:ribosomal 50S subunit-recycling heat shock protein
MNHVEVNRNRYPQEPPPDAAYGGTLKLERENREETKKIEKLKEKQQKDEKAKEGSKMEKQ